ncbi:MAG: Electron transport complex protein rnfE [uncultured bacterium]|nr:MAG: Electron transport complex protein rnfE [uncultured bacterium]
MNPIQQLTKGFWKDNPIFVIGLGLCPALAVSSSLSNAVGMGIAATFVLIGSNMMISLLRHLVPGKIRIPVYIVIIATFVTIIDKMIAAYSPALSASLGIFIPLIVVNCIILGRAEAFANKNGVFDSLLDAIGMGIGFTIALCCIAFFRELLGEGKLFGHAVPFFSSDPALIMIMAPGGFIVFGLLIALKRLMASKGGN